MLKNLKIVVTLGKIAFDSCLKLFNLKKRNFKFFMELDIKLTKIWKSSLVIIQALGTLTQKELIEEKW